jgi:hypothetical protein
MQPQSVNHISHPALTQAEVTAISTRPREPVDPSSGWRATAALVISNPGLTCAELASRCRLRGDIYQPLRYQLMRMLHEARDHAVIHQGDKARVCGVSGDTASTWHPGPSENQMTWQPNDQGSPAWPG